MQITERGIGWLTGFLDSPSAQVEPFWLALTGTRPSARRGDGTFVTLLPPDGDAFLRAQVVGSGPARCHLDLHVFDVPQMTRTATGLGAAVMRTQEDLVVLESPAGIVFCLVNWHGERTRPASARWPGGQRSLVDQLCLDVPAARFEAEAQFWAQLTGWPRRPTDLPEFEFLRRPDGMPLRLLMQRLQDGPAGVHVDFACDDVDAEVARHVELGATVVRRVPGDWTTLRDPAGREYCVTARSPDIG